MIDYGHVLATVFVFGVFYCYYLTLTTVVYIFHIHPYIEQEVKNLHYNTVNKIDLHEPMRLLYGGEEKKKRIFEGYVAYAKRVMLELNDTRKLVVSYEDYTITVDE